MPGRKKQDFGEPVRGWKRRAAYEETHHSGHRPGTDIADPAGKHSATTLLGSLVRPGGGQGLRWRSGPFGRALWSEAEVPILRQKVGRA